MKIGIIGSGSLGSALGERLQQAGHDIVFGGGRAAPEVPNRPQADIVSNSDAARFGDVVVLAVPFTAIDAALSEAGALDGRVLWCCVNALKDDLSGPAVGFNTSAAEEVARRAEGARVVAAIPPFAQAIASGNLTYDQGLEPTVFLCSDDPDAKQIVEPLVRDIGAEPTDAGALASARLVEPAMALLVQLAYAGAPRDIGLRLLERAGAAEGAADQAPNAPSMT
jgi:8-hydroxy-5-deazaflavin:NADPH oxidoreductase